MIPEFKTNRLILRGVAEADIPSWQRNFNDYEVIRYLSAAVPWPYPENGVEDFLKKVILPIQGNDRWLWGLFLKTNPNEMIGGVDLWRQGRPEHRGFWLARKLWGQGLMTEAVAPIVEYAFTELGFEKLIFSNALGNLRSRRIKEKTGAQFLEVRPARFVDPQFTSHELWQLTKEDWQKSKTK